MNSKEYYQNILNDFNTESLTNNDPYILYVKFKKFSDKKKYNIFIFFTKKYTILTDYQKFIVILTIFLNNFIELFKKLLIKHVFNPFVEYNGLSLIKIIFHLKNNEIIRLYKNHLDNNLSNLLTNIVSNNEELSFNELQIKKSHIIYLFKIAFYTNDTYIIKMILDHPLYTQFNNEIIKGISYCYDLLKIVKYDNCIENDNFMFKPDFIKYIINLRHIYIFNMLYNNCYDSIVDFIEYSNDFNLDKEVKKYLFMYDSLFNIHLEMFEEIMNEKYPSDYSNNDY